MYGSYNAPCDSHNMNVTQFFLVPYLQSNQNNFSFTTLCCCKFSHDIIHWIPPPLSYISTIVKQSCRRFFPISSSSTSLLEVLFHCLWNTAVKHPPYARNIYTNTECYRHKYNFGFTYSLHYFIENALFLMFWLFGMKLTK